MQRGSTPRLDGGRQGAARRKVVAKALFEPPPFQPSKLAISFAPGTCAMKPSPPESRRYTLTHNDLTGELWLTVGAEYNAAQVSGFYTRLLRDEVVAEWRCDEEQNPQLHVYCHVSGEERWLAPPVLRNYIFRREMPLVLDCIMYTERELLKQRPELGKALVYIHFESTVQALDSVECWGVLGDRRTWQAVPTSIMKRIVYTVMRLPLEEQLGPSPLGHSALYHDAEADQPAAAAVAAVVEEVEEAGAAMAPASKLVAVVAAATLETSTEQQQQQQVHAEDSQLAAAAAATAAAEPSRAAAENSCSHEDDASVARNANGNGNGNGYSAASLQQQQQQLQLPTTAAAARNGSTDGRSSSFASAAVDSISSSVQDQASGVLPTSLSFHGGGKGALPQAAAAAAALASARRT